ncbi:MAG: hypothetical protein M1833_004396 [Piccolia ochrophora]|nr:MAG: hypothetical protein M1833_004396 [Piccolia ochrophora]
MPTNCAKEPSSMPGMTTDTQLHEPIVSESMSASKGKGVVVGLYGVPGTGKTFLLDQLRQELGQEHYAFYEGSTMIANVVPGGLDAFQEMEELKKEHWRRCAIDTVAKHSAESGQVAVVAGHFMFWFEEQEAARPVITQNDLDTYTHILYLDVPADVVFQRRSGDKERSRPPTSVDHLYNWQQEEKAQLRDLCRHHSILFSLVPLQPTLLNTVSTLLRDFRHHNEKNNLFYAERRLDEVLDAGQGQLETMLLIDADGTLTTTDTGALFWEKISNSQQWKDRECTLKALFSGPLGYSYTAFRQAALLYEETANDEEFDIICQDVASTVSVHPEFLSLLQLVAGQEHVGAVIVSCGLRRVWDRVFKREGLSETVKVIAGGRIADGFIVSASVKGALTARLRDTHQIYVWAFGDSPLDLDMLSRADQAIVVVGEEQTRSKSMDAALTNAIDNGNLRARQAVLPGSASPRLDTTKLPQIQLTDHDFVDAVLCRRSRHTSLQVLHATDKNAAKLLMTPMRDAASAGPVLRESHRRVGWYLATEYLPDLIGLEDYPIPHVQGRHTSGYRLFHEHQTLIVALMRGGEAMAFGVNDAFPLAMFLHASHADDIMPRHLQEKVTVVLVDSVLNSGKTVLEFVQRVRKLHATVRIVIVTGVAQAQAISEGSLVRALGRHSNVSLVALRLSDNKFTGRGTTDTGNRLFNTTHLP